MTRRWFAAAALVLVACLALAGCNSSGPDRPPPGPAKKVTVTFGVIGAPSEIDAFRETVAAYNAQAVTSKVQLVTWPDRDAMIADLALGKRLPDLYMLQRRDLARVLDGGLNQPLFDLLDERDVSYGDLFAREAIEAFSGDNDLQCMPFSASPMVLYYNTDLIDFGKLEQRGQPVPDEDGEWTFDAFRAAAEFASHPRRGTKGVYVPPTLKGLAPFVYSGGGDLFDDDENPTSLALSQDDDRAALRTSLEVLRDPKLTLSDAQLAQAGPEQWFERGKLGMIEGFRNLTPRLREVAGLHFDVVAMPTINDRATIGDLTGLCISSRGKIAKAADFLVYVLTDQSFASVTEAGYIVPANEKVARSAAFLQPDRQPTHAAVFNASVDDMQPLPVLAKSTQLSDAVDPLLRRLFTAPVIDDLDLLTTQIDEASRSVLDPDYVPPSPSSTESSSP